MVLHAPLYPELAMVRPEVTWEPASYGIRMKVDYPNGIGDEHHTIFPGHIRVNVIRVGQQPSQLMLFNVQSTTRRRTNIWSSVTRRRNGAHA